MAADRAAVLARLDQIRSERASVLQSIAPLKRAFLPLPEAEARMRAYIDDVAAKWEPNVAPFARDGDLSVGFEFLPKFSMVTHPSGGGSLLQGQDRLHAFLCFAFGEPLRKALTARLRALLEGQKTVGANERACEIHTLGLRVLELEVDEERVILQAEGQGLTVDRRGDADPEVVLTTTLDVDDGDLVEATG
jgi:hypothetical protein